jgi:hypothetical protein
VIEQNAPHKCAIIHRVSLDIWSGWNLSAPQFQYANNPPYSLGGGALLAFGNILEEILVAQDHKTLDKLAQKFIDVYKSVSAGGRYDEASEKTLMDLFAVMDDYAPPDLASKISGSSITSDINEIKQKAQRTLSILEKHSDS